MSDTKKLTEDINSYFEKISTDKDYFKGFSQLTQERLRRNEPTPTKLDYNKYDRFIEGAIDPIFGNIEEVAAQKQSSFEKLGKGLLRVGTKAVTEIAKMPGEIYGLGEWGFKGFNMEDFESSVNNAWVNGISEFNDSINEDVLKVHVPQSVQEGGLWKNITSSSFWATEGADGVGFLLSMFVPGQALKTIGIGKKLVGATGELAQLSSKTAKLLKPGTKFVQKLGSNVDDFLAASVNTAFESASEGIETAKAVENKLVENKVKELTDSGIDYEQAISIGEEYRNSQEVKEKSGKAGYKTFEANLGILLLPNIIDQKLLFKSFKPVKGALGKLSGKMSGESLLNITPKTTKELLGEGLKKTALGVGKEGFFEEGMQYAASKYAENKELDPENAKDILSTYVESLGETDMQKSIFLGSVLGGVMGGIGGYRTAKSENEYLFGREASKPSKLGEFLGKEEKETTPGYVNILKKDFIQRFKGVNDILKKNPDGSIYLEDGKPITDNTKSHELLTNVADKAGDREALRKAYESGNEELFLHAKNNLDYNYMMDFIPHEGGYELLKENINSLTDEELKTANSGIGKNPEEIKTIREDLLKKADQLNKIYKKAERSVGSLITPKNEEEVANLPDFDRAVVDQFVTTEFENKFFDERINKITKEINESFNHPTTIESLEKESQLNQGAIIVHNGETKIVTGKNKKDNLLRVRNKDGKLEELNLDEVVSHKPDVIKGIPIPDRVLLTKNLELKDNYEQAKQENLKLQEEYSTPQGQRKKFDEHINFIKESIKKATQEVTKEAKDKVKSTNKPSDIINIVSQSDPIVKKEIKKEVENNAINEEKFEVGSPLFDDEGNFIDEPSDGLLGEGINISQVDMSEVPPLEDFRKIHSEVKSSEPIKTEQVPSESKKIQTSYYEDVNNVKKLAQKIRKGEQFTEEDLQLQRNFPKELETELLKTSKTILEKVLINPDTYYNNKPSALANDIINLFGDGKDKGLIENKIEGFDTKQFHNLNIEDKEQAYKDFLTEIISKENKTPQDLEVIKIINDYFSKKQEKLIELKKKEDIPVESDFELMSNNTRDVDKESVGVLELPDSDIQLRDIQEQQDESLLNDVITPLPTEKKRAGKKAVSMDYELEKVDNRGRGQAYQIKRDKETKEPIPASILQDPDIGERLKRGRELLNRGRVKINTPVKFRVDKKSNWNKYNLSKDKFQIEILANVNGKEELIGLVPKDDYQLRDSIWNEITNSTNDIIESTNTGSIEDFLSGKIVRGSNRYSPAQLTENFFLSVVKPKPSGLYYDGPNLPEEIKVRDASNTKVGQTYLWMKHPAHGRWVNVRVYTKKLNELPELKESVVQKLKQLKRLSEVFKSEEKAAKSVIDEIRQTDAVIKFNYNNSVITPLEMKNGVWVEKPNLRVNVDELTIDHPWINNLVSQVLVNQINKGDYNKKINDRLETNATPGVFSDINFTYVLDKKEPKKVDIGIETIIESKPIAKEDTVLEPLVKPKEIIIPKENKFEEGLEIDPDAIDPIGIPREPIQDTDIWNQEEELTWFNERFPDVPITVLENIKKSLSYNKEVWGLFKNAAVYIQNNAGKGTVYHEAFHVVFNMYATDKERKDLLQNTTEEELADAFMDYKIGLSNNLIGRVINFFKGLLAYLKYLVSRQMNSDLMFSRIERGYYTNKPFTKDIKVLNSDKYTRDRKDPNLKSWKRQFINDEVKAINNYLINSLIPIYRKTYSHLEKASDEEILKSLASNETNSLLTAYKQVYKALVKSKDNIYSSKLSLYNELLKSMEDTFNAGEFRLGSLLDIARRDLRNYGLKINGTIEEEEFENFQESASEVGTLETWQQGSNHIDFKERIPYQVKKFIRNLAKKNDNGEIISDSLGLLPIPVNFDVFYDTLLKDISKEEELSGMLEQLNKLSIYHPEYKDIYNALNSDRRLATKFHQAIHKPEQEFIFISEIDKGEATNDFIITSANKRGLKDQIVNEWAIGVENIRLSTITSEKFNNRYKTILDKLNQYKNPIIEYNSSSTYGKDYAKLLSSAGIEIPGNFLNNVGELYGKEEVHKIIGAFNNIIAKLAEGKDPFTKGVDRENKSIDTILNMLKEAVPSLTQSSFNNHKDKRVYSHLEGNYIVRLFNRLKKSNASLDAEIKYLLQDEFYNKGLVILSDIAKLPSDIKTRIRNSINYYSFSGTRMLNETEGRGYEDLTTSELNSTLLSLFANNGNKKEALYWTFVVSDATAMPLIKWKRYTQDESLDNLVKVARAEVFRIQRIKSRQSLPKDRLIENYDISDNGTFEKGFKILSFLGKSNIDWENINFEKDWNKVKKVIKEYLDKETEDYKKVLINQGIIKKDSKTEKIFPVSGKLTGNYKLIKKSGQEVYKDTEYPVEEFIKDFIYNDFFMRTQSTLLLLGDPTFYKAKKGNIVIDIQKRSKEVISPRGKIDTSASYNNEVVGTEYRGIILEDRQFPSNVANSIYENLIKAGTSERDAMSIASKYGYSNFSYKDKEDTKFLAVLNKEVASVEFVDKKFIFKNKEGKVLSGVEFFYSKKVNQTDAQAYITLPFYKRTMVGMERWTDKHEEVFQRLINKKGTKEDMLFIFAQPLKPFAYGMRQIFVEETGEYINVPTQHKNSEYLLIPQLVEKAGDELQFLYNFMMAKNVDIANFESAAKVGSYGKTTPETLGDNTIIHTYNMSLRGIQQENPEHFMDYENFFGTQFRSIIMNNLIEGEDYIINEDSFKPVSKKAQELYDLYNSIIVANINEAAKRIEKEFNLNTETVKKQLESERLLEESDTFKTEYLIQKRKLEAVKNVLIEQIKDRNKGEEYEEAIEIIDDSETGMPRFALPLFHPMHSKVIESLINSVYKSRITKQKIKGGALVQVSNFGFTNDLNVVMKDGRLDYVECKIPIWDTKLFAPYIMDNGEVEIELLEKDAPDLLEAIGYRIPTEDKYSMLPLKVVGFLPLNSGGSIMLPADITTISGSDFDIDKLYVMFHEGRLKKVYKQIDESDINIESLKTVEFSEEDMKEAEEIMKECKGRASKSTGRISKSLN